MMVTLVEYATCEARSGVYRITNTVNGKFYIGSASNLYGRWRTYKCLAKTGGVHNHHLQAAFAKYGLDKFACEVLEFIPDKSLLAQVEQRWMDELKPAYNFQPRAERPTLGKPHKLSPEVHAKRAHANRGKTRTLEQRARISAGKLRAGWRPNEEQRAKISAAQLGKKRGPHSPEHRARIGAANKAARTNTSKQSTASAVGG
jgi:group I intron endonuclease